MSRSDIISIMQSTITDPATFDFDHLMGPGLFNLLSPKDVQDLNYIATSVKYSGNIRKKYKAIDSIMKPRGFKKVGAGTNRVVYQFLEDHSFLLKIAVDDIGMGDNPKEFRNQMVIKPFCSKTFEVDPTGTVAVVEQVNAIQNRKEFESVADDIYELITGFLIGKYIMADIGTHYFMNWGVRTGFGPVLIDYPYLYRLDGDKLHCTAPDPNDPTKQCNGIIDYDDGFNKLYCSKCGKWYRVRELAQLEGVSEKIFTSGKNNERSTKMKFNVRRGDTIVASNMESGEVLSAPVKSIVKMPIENNNVKTGKFTFTTKRVPVKDNNKSTSEVHNKPVPEDKQKKHVYQAKSDNTDNKPYYNHRGTAYGSDQVVKKDDSDKFKKKKNNTHYRRVKYNEEFNMLSGISDEGKKAVFELNEYPEVVKQIVDNSEYAKTIIQMKSNTIETLQKNNKDLMESNDSLMTTIETLKSKLANSVSSEEYDSVVTRMKQLEQEVLDLKFNNPANEVADAMVNATEPVKVDYNEVEAMDKVADNVEAAFMRGYVTDTDKLGLKMHDGSKVENHKVVVIYLDDVKFDHLEDMIEDINNDKTKTDKEKEDAITKIHTLVIDRINDISIDRLLKNIDPRDISYSDILAMAVNYLDGPDDEEETDAE